MLVYRYMSLEELHKVTAGVIMHNRNNFTHNATNSRGFCFLPESVKFWSESLQQEVTYTPVDCFRFLYGVVKEDSVLVEFETEEKLNNSYGIYADPLTDDWDATISIDELCIDSYDRDSFIPRRFCYPGDEKWYELN